MATSEGFKEFVLETLDSALHDTQYRFSAKKMFGEYCIYVLEISCPEPTKTYFFAL